MLAISIPSADLWLHQKIKETVNGRAIFVIVVVERILIFIAGIANPFSNCECKKADEQIVQIHTEIDHSEAEKYKFTHGSCIFLFLFFPT